MFSNEDLDRLESWKLVVILLSSGFTAAMLIFSFGALLHGLTMLGEGLAAATVSAVVTIGLGRHWIRQARKRSG